MIHYPLTIEPDGDEVMAFFADVPGAGQKFHCAECAIERSPQMLLVALTALFASGKPMPPQSPIHDGQVGVPSPIFWLTI